LQKIVPLLAAVAVVTCSRAITAAQGGNRRPAQDPHDQHVRELERQIDQLHSLHRRSEFEIRRLESNVRQLESQVHRELVNRGDGAAGAVLFLIGVFCALWAQNTNRNSWLWFFMGLLFNFITLLVLLTKNARDKNHKRRNNLRST